VLLTLIRACDLATVIEVDLGADDERGGPVEGLAG
jgi:hypothetical protein